MCSVVENCFHVVVYFMRKRLRSNMKSYLNTVLCECVENVNERKESNLFVVMFIIIIIKRVTRNENKYWIFSMNVLRLRYFPLKVLSIVIVTQSPSVNYISLWNSHRFSLVLNYCTTSVYSKNVCVCVYSKIKIFSAFNGNDSDIYEWFVTNLRIIRNSNKKLVISDFLLILVNVKIFFSFLLFIQCGE